MSILSLIALAILVGACLFAWFRGGPAERLAALAIAIAWVASMAVQLAISVRGDTGEMLLLAIDGALAVVLLLIAFRWSSVWLGVAMLLQSAALASHAMEFAREIDLRTYLTLLNIMGFLMLAAVIGATIAYRHRAASAATGSAPRGLAAFR